MFKWVVLVLLFNKAWNILHEESFNIAKNLKLWKYMHTKYTWLLYRGLHQVLSNTILSHKHSYLPVFNCSPISGQILHNNSLNISKDCEFKCLMCSSSSQFLWWRLCPDKIWLCSWWFSSFRESISPTSKSASISLNNKPW